MNYLKKLKSFSDRKASKTAKKQFATAKLNASQSIKNI